MGKVAQRTMAGMTCLVLLGAIDLGVPRGIDLIVQNAEAFSTDQMPLMPDMMNSCSQMMAQMGGMGGMAPQARTQPPRTSEPTEHGMKQAGGLEVTLLSAPPLSPEEMQRMMPGTSGGMQGMGGMPGGTMGGMMGGKGMGGMMSGQGQGAPTHWIGVVVRDVKDDRAVRDLDITLVATKGGLMRTAKLMPMPGSYGANISLPEKGRYTVTITITVARPGQPVSVAFPFDYK